MTGPPWPRCPTPAGTRGIDPGTPGTPLRGIDHQTSAQDITAHLIAAGHRRIARMAGPDTTGLLAPRLSNYPAAFGAAGLPADLVHTIAGDFTAEGGARAVDAMLALTPRPTAVFRANDEMGMGLIGALARRGVRVPQDISVAGLDDFPLAACLVPSIAIIGRRCHAMAWPP